MENFQKTSEDFWGTGVFLFCLLVVFDQASKKIISHQFLNRQFAFSLPLPVWLMFLIYTLVILGMIIYCVKNYRQFSFGQSFAWLLIFTGAVLNVGERLVLGYVRDFIYIHLFQLVGVYNLADFYILAGLVLSLILPMLTKHRNIPR